MYKLEAYKDGYATVVNEAERSRSDFIAASPKAADALVVGLNQPVLLNDLAIYRFMKEVGGLSIAGGLEVLTDRESQAQLSSAFVTLQAGLVPDTDWKAANGWEVVTLEQIKPIATAVAAHVRACFRGERMTEATIKAAATMVDVDDIDIPALFTAAYRAAYEEVIPADA